MPVQQTRMPSERERWKWYCRRAHYRERYKGQGVRRPWKRESWTITTSFSIRSFTVVVLETAMEEQLPFATESQVNLKQLPPSLQDPTASLVFEGEKNELRRKKGLILQCWSQKKNMSFKNEEQKSSSTSKIIGARMYFWLEQNEQPYSVQ